MHINPLLITHTLRVCVHTHMHAFTRTHTHVQHAHTIFSSTGPVESSTLHVNNLPFTMTEAELMSLFPGSTSAKLISDHATGLNAG